MTETATRWQRRMQPLLGTYVEIAAVDSPATQSAIEAAFASVGEVQRLLSFHDPDSELSQLNQSAGKRVGLSATSRRVLRLAQLMQRATDGLFNCTVGGAMVRGGHLPDHGGIAPLDAGCADDIIFEQGTVRLARPVRITLDGIAKGFAVDVAASTLRRHGIQTGWINAGGDLKVFGELVLPVGNPGSARDAQMLGGLQNAAIATSRTSDADDVRYPGRIISAQGHAACGQWSVLARHAWRADALTKVAALAPPEQRDHLLGKLGGRAVPVAAESH